MDLIGLRNRANFSAHPSGKLLAQLFAGRLAGHERHIGVNALALDVMRIANDGGFRHMHMRHQRAFHLRRAHAMAGHVNHVIDAARDPIIAILIAAAAIAGKIFSGIGGEIGFHEAIMIAIDRAHLPRPGIGDDEIARTSAV